MQIRFPQSSQTKPMRSTCCQTLTHPKTVYKNPIRKDERGARTTPSPEPSVQRAVTLGKRSALLNHLLRLCCTPCWLVNLLLAQQGSMELPSNLEGTQRRHRTNLYWEKLLPLPAFTCFPLLEPSHQAWPEISMENLWYPDPHMAPNVPLTHSLPKKPIGGKTRMELPATYRHWWLKKPPIF